MRPKLPLNPWAGAYPSVSTPTLPENPPPEKRRLVKDWRFDKS